MAIDLLFILGVMVAGNAPLVNFERLALKPSKTPFNFKAQGRANEVFMNTKNVLRFVYPSLVAYVNKDGWISIHNSSTVMQNKSCDAMYDLHQRGYKFDVITNDGKELNSVNLEDAKIKFRYTISSDISTYPANGIKKWRVAMQPKSNT